VFLSPFPQWLPQHRQINYTPPSFLVRRIMPSIPIIDSRGAGICPVAKCKSPITLSAQRGAEGWFTVNVCSLLVYRCMKLTCQTQCPRCSFSHVFVRDRGVPNVLAHPTRSFSKSTTPKPRFGGELGSWGHFANNIADILDKDTRGAFKTATP
jgi:hypothetical protein